MGKASKKVIKARVLAVLHKDLAVRRERLEFVNKQFHGRTREQLCRSFGEPDRILRDCEKQVNEAVEGILWLEGVTR